jgi:ketosteroid isomerase-like protein
MGEQERELGRRGVEAFNAGDVDTLATMTHPDCELRGMRYEVDGTSYHGPKGVREFWEDATELWDDMRMEDTTILDREGRVLVLCRLILRGRGSGAVVEHDLAIRSDLRDGLGILVETTLDVERARREFEEG